MAPRDLPKWKKHARDEVSSVLADLDPEALTRCLVKGIATIGTSNPGWRLDTQGFVSHVSPVNLSVSNKDVTSDY
jgi:hypothetical protein